MTILETVEDSHRVLITDLLNRAKRGESIRESFAEHARVYLPGEPARSITEFPELIDQLTGLIISLNVYTDQLNFIHGRDSLFIEGMGDGAGSADRNYRVVRWCIKAEIYAGLIRQFYWYADGGYRSDDTNIVIAA